MVLMASRLVFRKKFSLEKIFFEFLSVFDALFMNIGHILIKEVSFWKKNETHFLLQDITNHFPDLKTNCFRKKTKVCF